MRLKAFLQTVRNALQRFTTPINLRNHGPRKHFLKKYYPFVLVARFLRAHPVLFFRCTALLQKFGLYSFLRSFYFFYFTSQASRNSSLKVGQLPPRASQIYADLKAAIEHSKKESR